jgi:hypothetical protein
MDCLLNRDAQISLPDHVGHFVTHLNR